MTQLCGVTGRGLMALLLAFAVLTVPLSLAQEDERQTADDAMLQKIETENEAVITGRHFTYDPAGRRDPFEPLVRATPLGKRGKRPKGIAGMLVSEIDLRGISTDVRGGSLALFTGSDNRGYTLRVGDVVYDGRVISIDKAMGIVVFRQNVDDPRRIKPYRDVFKKLYPADETDEEDEG